MPERWRRTLGAIDGVEPDEPRLRDRALRGPRLPDPAPSPARPLIAGVVTIALAAGSFGLMRSGFGDGQDERDLRSSSPPPPLGAAPDPNDVCDVPAYDPSVALLGERYDVYIHPAVGPLEVPLDVLQMPGEPGTTISGPATDELRRFLASGEARHAPADGWRAIVESDDEVIFAAPPDGGYSDWWIVRFRPHEGGWRFEHTELVDQHQTPAQLGHDLQLTWIGPVVMANGEWNTTLELSNGRADPWTIGEDGYQLWGHVHVFDPVTGAEIGRAAETLGGWGGPLTLEPSATTRLPLSFGGALDAVTSGRSYDVIACVPEIGLASPAGSLRVEENTLVRSARVLTYSSTGGMMQALAFGKLVVHEGCLAIASGADDPRPTYVIWPDGYSLLERGGSTLLIDPVGRELARLGQDVRVGGGYVRPDLAERAVIGGIPGECRAGGDGYFLTGGVES